MSIDLTGLPNNKATNERTTSAKQARGDNSNATPLATGEGSSAADTVSLTGTAAKLRQLEAAMSEMPDTDQDRISAVKRAVTNGTYDINPQRIAEKMLDFERSLTR